MRATRLFDTGHSRRDEEREILAVLGKAKKAAEAQLGMAIPRPVWEMMKKMFGGGLTDREEAEGFAEFVSQYVEVLAAWESSRTRRAVPAAKHKRPSPRALERNIELVLFITERVIPFVALREGHFHTAFRRGPRLAGQAGPWEELCEEWNRLHPRVSEQKGSGETLRREYLAAIRNGYITSALLEKLRWRQARAVLQRLCVMAPSAPPASVGNACILDLPTVKASRPEQLQDAMERANRNPLEALRILGATEDELRAHADAVRTYLREHATLEDRLARATLDAEVAQRPLLGDVEERPEVTLCACCLMPDRFGDSR
jgi:hypothetical protein